MAITINGNGTIGGVSVGGLPDGIVDTDMLANTSVSQGKIASNVAGNGPSFGVIRTSSNQSYSSNTWTKVQLNTKLHDTANCFDSTTNYRFTPNIEGYYQISGGIQMSGTGMTFFALELRVNGNETVIGPHFIIPNQNGDLYNVTGSLFYLNGSTDYVELWGYTTGSSLVFVAGSSTIFRTWMNGALVRAA